MKTLKDFDYDLWTTEENGIKKYYVRAKTTGEVTEVDAGVMRLLRSEEKKMRRYIKEQNILGTPLSLDSHTDETVEGTWLADSYDLNEDVQTAIMEAALITPCLLCREPYMNTALKTMAVLRLLRTIKE